MNLFSNNTKKKIIILCCALSSMPLLAQNSNKVTINSENISIEQALIEVQKQTSKSISFNSSSLPGGGNLLNINNKPLEEALTEILRGSGFSFIIKGDYIMIVPESEVEKAKQSKSVSGRIVDSKGEALIGVTILEKGTTNGTVTDFDGNYTLTVSDAGATLQYSYVGYNSVEKTAAQSIINITMREDTEVLEEVVVTALGIKRAEKALSYNVQQVDADDILRNKDANFVNALNGKVAGLNINASSSGVGGASKVIMRGMKSISQTSNALYVIDGVPMYTTAKEGGTEFDSQGSSDPIADINPEDIESISVLTGAAAAALYGSDAANGAIVITTKKGKAGKTSVTVSAGMEMMNPFVLPKFQNRYGTGDLSSSVGSIDRSWGAPMNSANNPYYNPADDYFNTGITHNESVSISTGTDKNQTYFSGSVIDSYGIVPNNKYQRYNFTFRNSTSFLNDKMHLDVGASYIYQKDRNMINQGTYNNPLVGAYLFPRGNDWDAVKMYERFDPTRGLSTQYWPVGDAGMTMQNPYWINNRNLRENSKNRFMFNASLSYDILDWLNVSGRVRMDQSVTSYTEKFYASTVPQLTEGSINGLYGVTESRDRQIYADVLVNINKRFGDDWSLQANIGASISDMYNNAMKNRGPIADGLITEEKPGLANVFNIQNLSNSTKTTRLQEGWREQTQSIFASAEVGYKSTYYLTLTARNDWPSQLAGPHSNKKSFFYPSVGASVILSELFKMPENLDFLKVRASYASVGTAFERYIANPQYKWNSSGLSWNIQTQYPMYDLKPELTNSVEVGITVKFFNDFNLDATYYHTNTLNQTFNPQISTGSGSSEIYIQSGNVLNQGVELSLGYGHQWRKFGWNTSYTMSLNRNKIVSLADNVLNAATGEYLHVDQLDMKGMGQAHFILREGGTLGDLYSLSDYVYDSSNKIQVSEDGTVGVGSIKDTKDYVKLGSVLPKANMAWRNDFRVGNLNFGFLLSARLGGVVYSSTQALLDYYGVSEASAAARDNGGVYINGGDNLIDANKWYAAVGGSSPLPQEYTYSATNLRLQEASIGYTFPKSMLGDVCDINVSIVGRNLWMIYCKAPFDPEAVATTGNYYQGIDHFMMPSLRSYGFNVKFIF